MSDALAAIAAALVVLVPVAVFVRQFSAARAGSRGRGKALLLFLGYSVLPVLVYALYFFGLVGLEELTGRALVSEGIGRSLLLVLALGTGEVLILALVFALALAFLGARAR